MSGIAIRKSDQLHYPKFKNKILDDRSTTYVYELPVGMPSKIIRKVEDVVSEGLNKPVRIQYDNYKLNIRVFHQEIPKKWEWSTNLIQAGKWLVPIGQSLEQLMYHDFDRNTTHDIRWFNTYGKDCVPKECDDVSYYCTSRIYALVYY